MENEVMRAILALNQLDSRIVRGKLRLQELGQATSAQERAVEEARAKAREIESAIREKVLDTDRLNMEIRAFEAETGDQERKLKAIKNQREFRIVTDRIKDLKIRVDETESQVIAGMEDLDKLREQVAACHTRIGEEDLKLTSLRQDLQGESGEIKAAHAGLLKERKTAVELVGSLDPAAYQAYDLALKRTKGDPLAEMSDDGICQSCFRRLNSNVANIVHVGKDVKSCRCQGCGRILYVREPADREARA